MSQKLIKRYEDGERLNHWAIALLFVCAGLSGLAFFHPALFWLTNFFGGGPWTRILHPYLGLLMVLFFVPMFVRMWRHNVWTKNDSEWRKQAFKLIATADETAMPPVGRYNAGQKLAFWSMAVCLVVLLLTGIVFWRAWVGSAFPIWLVRTATLLHAAAATVLILTVIVHVYAAIWVKGTFGAMTRGTVSDAWAKHNHPLWHEEVTGGK